MHLDGLRGFVSLLVLSHHCFLTIIGTPEFDPGRSVPAWLEFLFGGRLGVDMFVVLSGYVLMLPVATRGNLKGVGAFFKKRAWRIMPPYYVALAVSTALLMLSPIHRLPADVWPPASELGRGLSISALGAHLVMLQCLKSNWIYWADPPLWNVATVWWIYAVFALALVPTWRRFGLAAAVGLAYVAGLALHHVNPHRFDPGAPWFLGLFSFGMAAAVWTVSPPARKIPWPVLGTVFLVCYASLIAIYEPAHPFLYQHWWMEMLAGAGFAFLLVGWSRVERVPLLSSTPLLRIGAFSYSLYLIHEPILVLFTSLILPLHLSLPTCSAAIVLVGAPLCVGAGYLFHLAVERPFIPKQSLKRERQVEVAAVFNPAP